MTNDNDLENIMDNVTLTGTDKVYLKRKDRYSQSWARRFLLKNLSLPATKTNDTCLDLACGDGFWSFLLEEWYVVTGEDISPGGIYVAKEKAIQQHSNSTFELVDSLKATEKFDIVFARGPSFWSNTAPDDEKFLDAIPKVLNRVNKKLIYITYSIEPYGFNDQKTSYYHNPDTLKEIFSSYGTTTVKTDENYLTVEVTI